MKNFKNQINLIPEQLGQGVLTKLGEEFLHQFGENSTIGEARISMLIPYEIDFFLTDAIDTANKENKNTLLFFTYIYDKDMLNAVNDAIKKKTLPKNMFIYIVPKSDLLSEKDIV